MTRALQEKLGARDFPDLSRVCSELLKLISDLARLVSLLSHLFRLGRCVDLAVVKCLQVTTALLFLNSYDS